MSENEANPSDSQPNPATSRPVPTGGARFVPPSIEELNRVLPQYEFVELIGAGGMGAVYKARQPKLNRFVAIKILPPIPDDELGFAERFEREAQSMAQLSHPHIVSVYDFGETSDGHLYFVMEFVEGSDLHQLISSGLLTLDHFYGWIPQVCDAIQYAHDHGIVHRDIKPANILIDREGRVKIADFGLAKLTGPDHQQSSLTQTNLSMGTPDYAAPEQIDGEAPVDWRSDIYSLGVVMYQMLTGRLPRGAFPLPSENTPGVDRRLDEVVLKAMQSEPAFRFQRASEIAHRLSEIWSQPDSATKATSDASSLQAIAPRRRASLFPIVAGLVAVSLLAGLVLFFVRHSHRNRDPSAQKAKVTATDRAKAPANSRENTKPAPPVKKEGSNAATQDHKGTPPPPKDFSRRPGPNGEESKPVNLAAFRDKLGSRKPFGDRLELMRRQEANLFVISKEGDQLNGNPLAELPKDLKPVVQLAVGQGPPKWKATSGFVLALQRDGAVRAWGDNSAGQCDLPESTASGIMKIAAGPAHGLALKEDGTVVAWGGNDEGQCSVPAGLANVTAIAAGRDFSVAQKSDGTVVAWGAPPCAEVPKELSGVKAISAGFNHVLVLRDDGTVATWGNNEFHQLDMPPLSNVKAITTTFGNSFALLANDKVTSWGGAGRDGVFPDVKVREMYGTGEALVVRDSEHRLIVHGPNNRPGAIPAMLRQLPREVRIEISEKLVFAYRAAELGNEALPAEPEQPSLPVVTETTPASPAPSTPMTEAGRQIEELREKFEAAYLDQVSHPYEDSLRQLNAFYLNHLETRQAEAAAARLLEEAVAWRDEAERVRAGEPLPETDDATLPAALIELRRTYRQNAANDEATRKSAEAALLAKYDEALQAMQDRFTQEQKLDDALEVKAFREQRQTQETN